MLDTDTDPHNHTPPKPEKKTSMSRSNVLKNHRSIKMKESDQVEEAKQKIYKKKLTPPSVRKLFSSSGLDMHEGSRLQTLVMGGGMGSGGGRICGGGRGSHGRDGTDAYYQNMIQANPNNALLLGNYAKFLKEVIFWFVLKLELDRDLCLKKDEEMLKMKRKTKSLISKIIQ